MPRDARLLAWPVGFFDTNPGIRGIEEIQKLASIAWHLGHQKSKQRYNDDESLKTFDNP